MYDPEANSNAHHLYPDLNYVDSMAGAVDKADVVALLTEWSEFREADPDTLGALVSHRRILDGRHALNANDYTSKGWQYRALGRPAQASTVELASDIRDETSTLVV